MNEKTLIILKPDAVQRELVGEIIRRFERRGFKLVAAKFAKLTREIVEEHYSAHKGRHFFDEVCEYISSSPVMLMVWQGVNVIELTRRMIGVTDSSKANPGTIRGDYSLSMRYNLIHGSDSVEAAKREISLYFSPEEIVEYDLRMEKWFATTREQQMP